MTKYQKVYQQMVDQNRALFNEFLKIHEAFVADPNANKAEFNRIGSNVMDVIRNSEKLLVSRSESTGYGKYSTALSDKFLAEVRKDFPKIDYVGII